MPPSQQHELETIEGGSYGKPDKAKEVDQKIDITYGILP